MKVAEKDVYSTPIKDKLNILFSEIHKLYPEGKIFCFDILCKSQKRSLTSIAKELGITSEQILSEYGYAIIAENDAKSFRTEVLYSPGNEPRCLEPLFSKTLKAIEKCYPQNSIDYQIVLEHKELYDVICAFSLWLGYKTVFDFLAAYGYSYCNLEDTDFHAKIASAINNLPKQVTTSHKKATRKNFLTSSNTNIKSLNDFYESTSYLNDYEDNMWEKDAAPHYYRYYYKFTSNLIMKIHYYCSWTNFGTTPTAKLDDITVAFRDGVTEYSLVKEKLNELKEERTKVKRSKKLDEQIKWLEYLDKNIDQILPKFTKRFDFNSGEQLCSESIIFDKTKISNSNIASKYVILDLETNGLRPANDDLLSISIYDPSNGKIYNRLLPLELQPTVLTTYINGIDDTDVENAIPLCQKEFNDLIDEFDLRHKTILYYSGGKFDYNFLNKYCQRHGIAGIELLNFENIKDRIASSTYSTGNLTKDNLCNALGINGVSEKHSGVNDCYLEWQLYEQYVYNRLLIKNNYIYQFSKDYVVPASYLSRFPKLAEFANIEVPKLSYQNTLLYEYYLPSNLTQKIRKFPTNISGISIENIINSMIGAKECDNREFLISNSMKLKMVGKLPSEYIEIPVMKREDGTLKSLDSQYEEYIRSVNETSNIIRSGITEVIDYIREKIFDNKEIRTQEITISENNRVLALCDLSSDDAVLEMKTFDIFSVISSRKREDVIRQMYYQKGNKKLYAMSIIFEISDIQKDERRLKNLIFKIYKVDIKKE